MELIAEGIIDDEDDVHPHTAFIEEGGNTTAIALDAIDKTLAACTAARADVQSARDQAVRHIPTDIE